MKNAIIVLIVVAVVAIGFFFFAGKGRVPALPPEGKSYENATYGIAFDYPAGYTLTEREAGNAERAHHVITLIADAEGAPPENGEGPTAISIDIYQNDLDRLSLYEWMTATNESNWKLGSGEYGTTSTGATESVTYRWSGLYEGETTAFVYKDNIIAVSVTTLTPQDAIIAAYVQVLRSLRLF